MEIISLQIRSLSGLFLVTLNGVTLSGVISIMTSANFSFRLPPAAFCPYKTLCETINAKYSTSASISAFFHYALRPAPCSLRSVPCALRSELQTLNVKQLSLNRIPQTARRVPLLSLTILLFPLCGISSLRSSTCDFCLLS
jgi:hypothetical protein